MHKRASGLLLYARLTIASTCAGVIVFGLSLVSAFAPTAYNATTNPTNVDNTFVFMSVLEFINYVLSLIGEQSMLSSAGNLGQLTRNCIYSSTLAVVQSTRATFFEQLITGTATNVDYKVPALVLPTEVAQVQDVSIDDGFGNLSPLHRQEFALLNSSFPLGTYEIIGSNVYLNANIPRPIDVLVRALVIPTLPVSDSATFSLPKPVQPAVAHLAASILCLSYVDDANAAAQHKRMADEMILMLRQQFGISKGRTFNVGHSRRLYDRTIV